MDEEQNPRQNASSKNTSSTTANQNDAPNTASKNNLVLFSIIVAITPQIRTSSIPIGGWLEAENIKSKHDKHTPLDLVDGKRRASASFLSVRRVHVSLARLCRVLEREERRCRYVSTQASMFDRIRREILKTAKKRVKQNSGGLIWEDQDDGPAMAGIKANISSSNPPIPPLPPSSSMGHTPLPSASPSPASVVSKVPSTTGLPTTATRHRRVGSLTVSFDRDMAPPPLDEKESAPSEQRKQEMEQEILETIMAAPPTQSDEMEIPHQGNLARELIQVYHALARNDHDFAPTPAILLSGHEGVVYINRHIAVSMEAVSPLARNDEAILGRRPVVRPYHTLLFPNASPSELLESMMTDYDVQSNSSRAPRRLQQLLRMVNPQKSLIDIAIDTNLPLNATIDIATYLVGQGACIVSPVLFRQTARLACCANIPAMIREYTLPFSQTFGTAVNLFVLVSFLTDSRRTLGETIQILLSATEDAIVMSLRESLELSLPISARENLQDDSEGITNTYSDDTPPSAQLSSTDSALEDLLYRMVVWLCSHSVLVQLQDYLVAKFTISSTSRRSSSIEDLDAAAPTQTDIDQAERKTETRLDNMTDEILFRELLESDCLNGKTSLQACSWRTGFDSAKITGLVSRHPQLFLIRRVPAPGDDWITV